MSSCCGLCSAAIARWRSRRAFARYFPNPMDARSFRSADFKGARMRALLQRAAGDGALDALCQYFRDHHTLGVIGGPFVVSTREAELRAAAQKK